MDPISLIVAALAAGSAAGAAEVGKDLYEALRAKVRKRLDKRDAELVLDKHAEDPGTWQAPLAAELEKAGAGDDPELIKAAQALLKEADPDGARSGKYTVDVRGAQGVQIGDHSRQENTFGPRS